MTYTTESPAPPSACAATGTGSVSRSVAKTRGRTRLGIARPEPQLGLKELARPRRARELEAHGAVIGLDDQLEGEEGAAGALRFDECGERRHDVVRRLEAQAVAVGQRALLAAVAAQQLEHLVATRAEPRRGERAGDWQPRYGLAVAHAGGASAVD